ncbi:hypothetical protein KBC79_02180 [Candidatus Woesebacteria bacterium]|nr:hypothetical protein [Candidatus Woesebacteria bacterium]
MKTENLRQKTDASHRVENDNPVHYLLTLLINPSEIKSYLSALNNEQLLNLMDQISNHCGPINHLQMQRVQEVLDLELLKRKLADTDTLNHLRARHTVHKWTLNQSNEFVDSNTGEKATNLAKMYSLMKFGSQKEITIFAQQIAKDFLARIDQQNNDLRTWVEAIANANEHIVLLVPGSRNVESASNYVYDQAIQIINAGLALRQLPTIVNVKLPKIGLQTDNYATLTQEQRAALPPITEHILPGKDFYQFPVHVLFGDDCRITGSTGHKVQASAQENGARSFRSLYLVTIDPLVAELMPSVEDKLNRSQVTGDLDESICYILEQYDFKPVQKLLRLLLDKKNRPMLHTFFEQNISERSLVKVVQGALGNNFHTDPQFAESVSILVNLSISKNLI